MPLKLHQDELPTINLTSMIDILFLLIIFFMVGTNFGMPEGHLLIDLPKIGVTDQGGSVNGKKTIEFKKDGSVYLEGRQVSLPQLKQQLIALKQQNPNLTVQVRGEDSVYAYSTSLEITNAVKNAGIRGVDYVATIPNALR